MDKKHSKKIYIAGHTALIGSAIVRQPQHQDYTNLITVPHSELDLTNQAAVETFFSLTCPDYVFHPAGKVGGIGANSGLHVREHDDGPQHPTCLLPFWG